MSTEEEDNFLRNITVIYSLGNKAFRTLLSNELSTQNLTFSDFISKYQHDIFHLHTTDSCCQCAGWTPNKRRVLHYKQMEILFDKNIHKLCHSPGKRNHFCCSETNLNVTLDSIDATSAQCLLLNFGICYKSNPALKTTAENLIAMRNKYAHSTELKITESEFEHDKYKITNLYRQIYPYHEQALVSDEIKEAYSKYLDRGLAKQYHCKMLEEVRFHQELLGKLMEIQDHHRELQNQQRQTNERLQKLVDMNESSCQHQETSTGSEASGYLKEIQDQRSKAIEEMKKDFSMLMSKIKEDESRSNIGKRKFKKAIRRSKVSGPRKTNMIEQSKLRVTENQKDDTYVETSAVREGLRILEESRFLVIVSKGGGGKTTLCLEIASRLLRNGIDPIIFLNNEILEKRDFINPNEKKLIIIEDLFGKKNVNFNNDIHKNILDCIKSWVESNESHLKVVMTISATANASESICKEHPIFLKRNVVLNLDNEAALTSAEKSTILRKHAMKHGIVISDQDCNSSCITFEKVDKLCSCLINEIVETDTFYGFPQSAHLFCSFPNLTKLGVKYFRNTSQALVDEVNEMRENGLNGDIYDLYKYVSLLYMAFTLEKLKLNYAQTDPFLENPIIGELFRKFEKNTNVRASVLNRSLLKIKGTFLKTIFPTDGKSVRYDFQHETIRDAVLVSYGSEYPDEILEMCPDLTFILDYVYPKFDGIEIDVTDLTEKSPAKIPVPSDLVKEKLIKLLLPENLVNFTMDDMKSYNQVGKIMNIKEPEKHSEMKTCDTIDKTCKMKESQNPINHMNTTETSELANIENPRGDKERERTCHIYGTQARSKIKSFDKIKRKSRHNSIEPYLLLSQSIGKYLLDWYLLNDNTRVVYDIFEFLTIVYISESDIMDCAIPGLIDGLTRHGKSSVLLEKMADLCEAYIPIAGNPSVLYGLVRPLSSKTFLSHGSKYMYVNDEDLKSILIDEILRCWETAFIFGQYVYKIAKEGNMDFLLEIIGCLINNEVDFRIGFFLDGLFDHGNTFTDLKAINLKSIIQKQCSLETLIQTQGSVETLVSCCRPDQIIKGSKYDFVLIEKKILLEKINESAEIYFECLNDIDERLSFMYQNFDLSLIAYGGENVFSVPGIDFENLFRQMYNFCSDLSDNTYSDQVLRSILEAMKNNVEEEYLCTYLDLFQQIFHVDTQEFAEKYPLSSMILNEEQHIDFVDEFQR